ncbi:16S rRNA (guanine(527)-N(7))-methyltransferase RsmG [Salinisphaera sp. P385]|uniref:Ribosomal RNA small subunit methyltransferase G n=1 Tax=Spectribacter acetivorans TaxID=3075603 RepID=A0ABU3BAQ2_9GAMM|nr:16S rRNA (guanine(527)-N(7))-methyltransferase RsmG [Salinisphaera sp. P385]MDT0619233.1 16S rRNA (guanine(527)-N(7))-methyltransferase RsmG [Salinisphaera sp. P385]
MTAPRRAGASVDWQACLDTLTRGARTLKVRTSAESRQAMIDYLKHLESWNRTYNLTAVREPSNMVVRHLLDSLSVVPYLAGQRFADVGTGPGLPGIPIALARPGKAVVLVESNRKKAAFLRHVVRVLGLDNVEVVQQRVESWYPPASFDTVICRAFAAAPLALKSLGHLCGPAGQVLLMKGRDPAPELDELPDGFRVAATHELSVPGLDAARHLVVVEPGLL